MPNAHAGKMPALPGKDARAPRRVALATIEFSPAFQRRENGVTSPRVA